MTETIQPHERRKWWPDAFVDECMPEGRSTPDAWLYRLNDGTLACEGDEAYGVAPLMLKEGQDVLFTWCDSLGTALIAQTDEGDVGDVVLLPSPPAGTNQFWITGDEDTICDDVEVFEEQARDFGHVGEIVTYSAFGEGLRLRFTALDGPPRFIAMTPVPGEPAEAVHAPRDDDAQGDLLRPSLTKTEA